MPLSYLTKSWFWAKNGNIVNINKVINYLPKDASVVTQNNIAPHISHRDQLFILWPEKKKVNNYCVTSCDWFRWAGNPEYLFVDYSSNWDIRHFLTQRQDFISGINNLEKYGFIKEYKKIGNTVLFKILKHP